MRTIKLLNGPIMLLPNRFNRKFSMDDLHLFVSSEYKYLEQIGALYYNNIKEYRI